MRYAPSRALSLWERAGVRAAGAASVSYTVHPEAERELEEALNFYRDRGGAEAMYQQARP